MLDIIIALVASQGWGIKTMLRVGQSALALFLLLTYSLGGWKALTPVLAILGYFYYKLQPGVIPPLHHNPQRPGSVRCVFLSDTHNEHTQLAVPPGDILIHCGDFTYTSKRKEVEEFNEWLGTLPHQHKLVIAGNHELTFDDTFYDLHWKKWHHPTREECTGPTAAALLTNAKYLQHEALEVAGLKIFASPYTPPIPGRRMAFNKERGRAMKDNWEEIPSHLDLLITHGPPYSILDRIFAGKHVGCQELFHRLKVLGKMAPQYHVFGHIHENRGMLPSKETALRDYFVPTTFINAACVTLTKSPLKNGPVIVDIIPKKANH